MYSQLLKPCSAELKYDCKWLIEKLVGPGSLTVEVSRSHSDTPHSAGIFWTSDQPAAETITWQHTTLNKRQKIHAPDRIRTANPSKRVTANPCLRPRSHWDRLENYREESKCGLCNIIIIHWLGRTRFRPPPPPTPTSTPPPAITRRTVAFRSSRFQIRYFCSFPKSSPMMVGSPSCMPQQHWHSFTVHYSCFFFKW
jgi:hypothetical protein